MPLTNSKGSLFLLQLKNVTISSIVEKVFNLCNFCTLFFPFICFYLDINECKQLPCADNEVCSNTIGNYGCYCKIGFTKKGDKCVDNNECRVSDNPGYDCDKNADCTNTRGSYMCTCHEGFEGNGKQCTDVDECKMGLHTCGENTGCENTDGGFHCMCDSGFMGDCNDCTGIIILSYTLTNTNNSKTLNKILIEI